MIKRICTDKYVSIVIFYNFILLLLLLVAVISFELNRCINSKWTLSCGITYFTPTKSHHSNIEGRDLYPIILDFNKKKPP